ncbi:uncharacterized protein LOC117502719 isoform X2 [Thalassophryne amazonica]|uniref:uncharacterized protein LOC117502719 isoform X2 n=1 Tax=Thalassophryne amazonica TaxID=390379 RepID=UPI001471B347|nr:uncharacterized protein LOC117502719 isoform X2 [Thalassophryne amazonica]XP_034017708.1 uncharacterized protein LOC117502719 isoform X2 [Thalassophryne amazonica]
MAAIGLERGLEHSSRSWGQEKPEMFDNFDSEMQEWEDQLQDIQRKIEELYSEVQARKGGNDITTGDQKNGAATEYGLGHHSDGLCVKTRSQPIPVPRHNRVCNCSPAGYSYPMSRENGDSFCHSNSMSGIGDFIQDYLGQGKQISPKNHAARHVHFSDSVTLSHDAPVYQDKIKRSEKTGQEQFLGTNEETENRKNRTSHTSYSPNKEHTGAKPPLGQRDAPAVQPRSTSQSPGTSPDSPAVERKVFSPSVLADRKCSSPSVLRKFEAMLQQNEGKTLTETGVVTLQGPASEPKCPIHSCHRRTAGASPVASRAPAFVSTQKCQADASVLTAAAEASQECGFISDLGRQTHKDQRGSHSTSKGSQLSPQKPQRKSQVLGSPKVRPRTNSLADRDAGLSQGERVKKPVSQLLDPKIDYRSSSGSSGPQKIQRGGVQAQSELPDCVQVRDEGLIELLDMLEIQHEYSTNPKTAGHTTYRQDLSFQVIPAEGCEAKPKSSFSRPARPANQRPPSRWASHTPTARITAPLYCPPSPLTRPPSPRTKTPSPALKRRPPFSFSRQTETVIM